ncbi:MAG TPA: hypothetical protein DCP51_03085 [Clostridiales bacterium]|nr:hypothetical protein [Clostridiales bacterium]
MVIAIKYNGVEKFTFSYDANGRLANSTDHVNGKQYSYEYDKYNRLVRASEKFCGALVMGVENWFDSLGRASGSVYTLPGKTMNYGITYKEKIDGAPYQVGIGKVQQYTLPTNATITYYYDELERVTKKEYSNALNVNYTYLAGSGASTTTPLVSDVEIKNGSASIIKYSYTYDNVGNILTVKENDIEKQSFTYDKLGQLTQEDNAYANQTYTYTYDAAGNITGKYRWE